MDTTTPGFFEIGGAVSFSMPSLDNYQGGVIRITTTNPVADGTVTEATWEVPTGTELSKEIAALFAALFGLGMATNVSRTNRPATEADRYVSLTADDLAVIEASFPSEGTFVSEGVGSADARDAELSQRLSDEAIERGAF